MSFLLNIFGSAEDTCDTNVAMETILLNNIQLNSHVFKRAGRVRVQN